MFASAPFSLANMLNSASSRHSANTPHTYPRQMTIQALSLCCDYRKHRAANYGVSDESLTLTWSSIIVCNQLFMAGRRTTEKISENPFRPLKGSAQNRATCMGKLRHKLCQAVLDCFYPQYSRTASITNSLQIIYS